MAYRIRLTAPAEADAYAAFDYIGGTSSQRAEAWLRGLFAAIQTLQDMPARCPVVREDVNQNNPVRHLLYGQRSAMYRIIFDIQDQSDEGPRVRILRIWHGVREPLQAEDLDLER